MKRQIVGNKAKRQSSKWVLQENKARQILGENEHSYLLIHKRTCEYQGVRNIHFSKNLARFVFL